MTKGRKIFIGRKKELKKLEELHEQKDSQFVIIYGRRRVGKTVFITQFCQNKKYFFFTGRKGEPQNELINRFLKELSNFCVNSLISKVSTNDWGEIFEIIDTTINEKIIIVLDEFQWMCTKKSNLISALQEHWDKKWKNNKKMFLILCGSIISFMEKDVLSEKSPLYGRRTASFELEAMMANEAKLFFPAINTTEQTEIIMTFGGIPSYLEIINSKESMHQNINKLALTKNSYFFDEIDFILREQLKNPARYYLLLENIAKKPMSREDLANAMRISNSGSLNLHLKNLQNLHLIKIKTPITKPITTKTQKYIIWDEFLRFYFYFILPNKERIQMNEDDWLYDKIISPKWESYCGYSFELFCRKNMKSIISLLGIEHVFKRSGTYWQPETKRMQGVQIDIIIERTDKITHLIECKWSSGKVGTFIIEELKRKKKLYPNPSNHTLKTTLITSHGVTDRVKKTGLIDNIFTIKDLLNWD